MKESTLALAHCWTATRMSPASSTPPSPRSLARSLETPVRGLDGPLQLSSSRAAAATRRRRFSTRSRSSASAIPGAGSRASRWKWTSRPDPCDRSARRTGDPSADRARGRGRPKADLEAGFAAVRAMRDKRLAPSGGSLFRDGEVSDAAGWIGRAIRISGYARHADDRRSLRPLGALKRYAFRSRATGAKRRPRARCAGQGDRARAPVPAGTQRPLLALLDPPQHLHRPPPGSRRASRHRDAERRVGGRRQPASQHDTLRLQDVRRSFLACRMISAPRSTSWRSRACPTRTPRRRSAIPVGSRLCRASRGAGAADERSTRTRATMSCGSGRREEARCIRLIRSPTRPCRLCRRPAATRAPDRRRGVPVGAPGRRGAGDGGVALNSELRLALPLPEGGAGLRVSHAARRCRRAGCGGAWPSARPDRGARPSSWPSAGGAFAVRRPRRPRERRLGAAAGLCRGRDPRASDQPVACRHGLAAEEPDATTRRKSSPPRDPPAEAAGDWAVSDVQVFPSPTARASRWR